MSTHPKQFVIYQDSAGLWRWRLFAANSRIIADSAESYSNKSDALHGVKLVAAVASGSAIWNFSEKKWEA